MDLGIAIVTYQAEEHIASCLEPLMRSPLNPRILVLDSSSTDKTVEKAEALGAKTHVIPQKEFNHGLTRERARKLLGTEIVLFLTQDAYLVDYLSIESLVAPIAKGEASLAYARQIPKENAGFFESFAREFNYPLKSQIRGFQDKDKYGVYTCFCSDSCAAYSNQALDEIGGFQEVLLGEDTLAAAKLLENGHKVAYVAEAKVWHSHQYRLLEEFQRHFDTGYYRKRHEWELSKFGKDSSRGKAFFLQMIKRLFKEKPYLIPYACLQTAMKWLGYQLGKRSLHLPKSIKKLCSSQKYYWKT